MAPRERWLAIVNPAAGSGAGAGMVGTLAATLADAGIRAEIERSPGPGESARLAAAAVEDGYDVVLAVGGDGTANEVANGMLGASTALALFPIGTGKDFAHNLGYPRRRRDIPRFLATAGRREIDVGLANGRAFVNHVGVGIDGVVAQRARGFGHYFGPRLGYAASSLMAIASFRPVPMHVTLDGETHEGKFLAVLACNGVRFGGGMKVAPEAKLDDGSLDAVLARDLGRAAAVSTLLKLYRGRHVDGGRVKHAPVRAMQIELERPRPMELDGEVSMVRSLAIEVRPRALRVVA